MSSSKRQYATVKSILQNDITPTIPLFLWNHTVTIPWLLGIGKAGPEWVWLKAHALLSPIDRCCRTLEKEEIQWLEFERCHTREGIVNITLSGYPNIAIKPSSPIKESSYQRVEGVYSYTFSDITEGIVQYIMEMHRDLLNPKSGINQEHTIKWKKDCVTWHETEHAILKHEWLYNLQGLDLYILISI